MMNSHRVQSDDDRSSWPYADMLGFGYFGSGTLAGRRHRNSSVVSLALLVVSLLAIASPSLPWALRVICAVAIPLASAGIVWSNIRYFSELDELSRLIQLEAAALSYGALFVVASIVCALGALDVASTVQEAGVAATRISGHVRFIWPLLAVLVVGELIRGPALVVFARRRR